MRRRRGDLEGSGSAPGLRQRESSVSRGRSIAGVFVLLLIAQSVACEPEEWSTTVGLELLFPQGEAPLDAVEVLRVRVVTEEENEEGALERVEQDVQVLQRPSSSSWAGFEGTLELGLVDFESAQVVIEGVDSGGSVVALGESMPIPLQSGRGANIAVFFQTVGTSGRGPSLERGWRDHGAAYLEGGGVFLAGGAEGDSADESWVYAIDRYEPIELTAPPEPRTLAGVATLGSSRALLFGGSQPASTALVYDPVGDDWATVDLPGETSSWSRPSFDRLVDGGVVALRGAEVIRFAPGPPAAAAAIFEVPAELAGGEIVVSGVELALVFGDGDPPFVAFDPSDGDAVDVSQPAGGGRLGHSLVALSDGRVVVAGGGEPLSSDVEVYDPLGDDWETVEGLLAGFERRGAAFLRLRDDRLLLVGGEREGTALEEAVVIDVDRAEATPITMAEPRLGCAVSGLPTGAVLVTGGVNEEGEVLDTVELLRPL